MIRILIADDNEKARGIVAEMLQGHDGWSVCAQVGNGREAVSKAIEMKSDIAILDLVMPEMDGLSAAREIIKVLPKTAIFIYTLHDSDFMEVEAKKAGVRQVISKMDAPEALMLAIEQQLKNSEAEAPLAEAFREIGAAPPEETGKRALNSLPGEATISDPPDPCSPNSSPNSSSNTLA